jgi:hypothetical protein
MDYRYVIKKRKKETKKKNFKGIFYKVLICLIFVSVTGGIIYGYEFLESKIAKSFPIKKIEIIGTKNIPEKTVTAYLKKFKGMSLLSLELKKVFTGLISKSPWIKDIILHKSYPDRLVVEVLEETPIGVINCGNDFYIVTDSGKVIKNFNKELLKSGLYIFTMKSLKDFPKYRDALLEIYSKIKQFHFKNISEIVFGNDIKIFTYKPHRKYLVSITSIEENLMKIKSLEKGNLKFNSGFKEVNLKYKDKIFIKL